jgi:hypothetical protein
MASFSSFHLTEFEKTLPRPYPNSITIRKNNNKMSSIVTVVEEWISVAEINQSWEGLDTVALCQLRVLNFHHLNAEQITFVVNVFQFHQDLVTGFAIGLV